MSNVLPLTIRPGALPPNATYTPQQFLDVLATALQIESQSQFALFVSGAVEPVFNAGPFLRDGITWRVWKDSLGAYGPLVMEQESLRYAVSFTAPDETKYDFWIRLDGAGKGQGVFKYFGAAWVDVYSDIFYSKAQIDTAIAGALPVGTMLPFAGAAAPTGYLICNGAAQSRAPFAQLFAVTGTTYGAGDLLTTFNLPDLRGRTLVGVGTGDAVDATTWTRGQKSGAETVTLTTAQTPAHSHGIDQYGANSTSSGGFNNTPPQNSNNQITTLFTGFQTTTTGGGLSHPNIQPSLGINYIIKT